MFDRQTMAVLAHTTFASEKRTRRRKSVGATTRFSSMATLQRDSGYLLLWTSAKSRPSTPCRPAQPHLFRRITPSSPQNTRSTAARRPHEIGVELHRTVQVVYTRARRLRLSFRRPRPSSMHADE